MIATSVTALDVHDVSRACRTYGIGRFYVTTPLKAQQELVKRIFRHWVEGPGGELNPSRKKALARLRVTDTLENVLQEFRGAGKEIRTVATGAKKTRGSLPYSEFWKKTKNDENLLFVFGTGWGLERSLVRNADYILDPVVGVGSFNHLPVRSAVSIILDRLFGREGMRSVERRSKP